MLSILLQTTYNLNQNINLMQAKLFECNFGLYCNNKSELNAATMLQIIFQLSLEIRCNVRRNIRRSSLKVVEDSLGSPFIVMMSTFTIVSFTQWNNIMTIFIHWIKSKKQILYLTDVLHFFYKAWLRDPKFVEDELQSLL